MKERGLKGVKLIISDACMGLYESVGDYYPEADWQRCMVHFHRIVANRVPSTEVKEVARMLKAIYVTIPSLCTQQIRISWWFASGHEFIRC